MTYQHPSCIRHRLDRTIRALCPLIEDQIKSREAKSWSEYELRKELVGCILGSQVRHEMAVAAVENLEETGLLDDSCWNIREQDFSTEVFNVLSGQRNDLRRSNRYRFPRSRATQLSQARDALAEAPLDTRLASGQAPRTLRNKLVADIPGLGPKQASMFLRNIGRSYDLAILDSHVLRFMDIQDILPMTQARIGTVAGYERAERTVVDYAVTLGYPVGYLDWAIWATMKAARELGL